LRATPLVIASEAKQSRENAPRLDCFTNGKLPQVRNDRNGTRHFQNTTFSIFHSPFSIRPKGAPPVIAGKSPVIAGKPFVIASEAKQSRVRVKK
jgi:hypothetical protein